MKLTERRSRIPHRSPADVSPAGSGGQALTGPEQINAFHRGLIERIASAARHQIGLGIDWHAGPRHGLRHALHDRRQSRSRIRRGGPAPVSTWCRRATFDTFGIQILRGRAFTDQDRLGTQPVALVNETFARPLHGRCRPAHAADPRRAAHPRCHQAWPSAGVADRRRVSQHQERRPARHRIP